MESFDGEESTRTLSQQHEELFVIDLAVTVEVDLVYHLLDIDHAAIAIRV
jgi:hypothetical protein